MLNQLNKAQQFIKKNRNTRNDLFKHKFHLTPELGWMNDPNGLSFFNGKYHFFYQNHPYSSDWGPMHWAHATSKNLLDWTHLPIALAPKGDGPDCGAPFSGSAIADNGQHILMYTQHWGDHQVQQIAVSTDGIHYNEISNKAVIGSELLPDTSSSSDFRDPKIFKKNGKFYAVVVSESLIHGSGQVLMFSSDDLVDWTFDGVIFETDNELGKMWECPDLFSVDEQDVLIFSPQFLEQRGARFYNNHSSVYVLGEMDFDQCHFVDTKIEEIDFGFDFYAPQTFIDDKGRRILVAWMSNWDRNIPSADLGHKWCGSLTLPRQLSVKNGCLYQMPIDELKSKRDQVVTLNFDVKKNIELPSQCCEIDLLFKGVSEKIDIDLFGGAFKITYNPTSQYLSIDRRGSAILLKNIREEESNENIRFTHVPLIEGNLECKIVLDVNSVELFIQKGLKTMTSLVYKHNNKLVIDSKVNTNLQIWDLNNLNR